MKGNGYDLIVTASHVAFCAARPSLATPKVEVAEVSS
jgi:hypothetical protein